MPLNRPKTPAAQVNGAFMELKHNIQMFGDTSMLGIL